MRFEISRGYGDHMDGEIVFEAGDIVAVASMGHDYRSAEPARYGVSFVLQAGQTSQRLPVAFGSLSDVYVGYHVIDGVDGRVRFWDKITLSSAVRSDASLTIEFGASLPPRGPAPSGLYANGESKTDRLLRLDSEVTALRRALRSVARGDSPQPGLDVLRDVYDRTLLEWAELHRTVNGYGADPDACS